jgi:PAS domain S-box-containing protein
MFRKPPDDEEKEKREARYPFRMFPGRKTDPENLEYVSDQALDPEEPPEAPEDLSAVFRNHFDAADVSEEDSARLDPFLDPAPDPARGEAAQPDEEVRRAAASMLERSVSDRAAAPPKQPPPAEPAASGGAPPRAFIQAMQSTRRRLREAEKKAARLFRELDHREQEKAALEQRLQAQRKALPILARDMKAAGAGPGRFRSFCETLARAMDLTRIIAGRFSPGGEVLHCLNHYAASQLRHDTLPPLTRGASPVFFMSLDAGGILRINEPESDPRLSELNSGTAWRFDGPVLIVPPPGPRKEGIVLCCQHRDEGRRWRTDEENFLLSLAHIIALLPEEEARNRPDIAPVQLFRKIPEMEIQEEAPLFRWLLDSMGGMVWAVDMDMHITYLNPAAEEAYGLDAMEMIGRPLADFAAPGYAAIDEKAIRNILNGHETWTTETRHLNAAAENLDLRVTLSPLEDETGTIVGVVGLSENRTGAPGLDSGLRESEAWHRNLVAAAPQVMWTLDAVGTITSVNAAVREVYGYAPEELTGASFTVLCAEDRAAADLESLYRLIDTGGECIRRRRHRRKDGTCIDVAAAAGVLCDENGDVTGAAGAVIPLPKKNENNAEKQGETENHEEEPDNSPELDN